MSLALTEVLTLAGPAGILALGSMFCFLLVLAELVGGRPAGCVIAFPVDLRCRLFPFLTRRRGGSVDCTDRSPRSPPNANGACAPLTSRRCPAPSGVR